MSNNEKSEPFVNSKSNDIYIVGIGASAGGLNAFESFFSEISPECNLDNMAFVLVQHLDPNHKSLLPELVQHYTKMKVHEVKDGMLVQANCVYVIPSNHDLLISDGALHLLKIQKIDGRHFAVDIFFNSLAKDKKNKAIGIVLSGTGHDGTKGLEVISGAGGITMAQSIESSEFSGMPSSAIATKIVDHVLSPSEMPKVLMRYANGSLLHKENPVLLEDNASTLKNIFNILQSETSHDFSMYKFKTMIRRIERRLVVNKIDTLDEYYKYLKRSKNEVQTLFQELLIGVTSFFRDDDVFSYLEKNVIAKLFTEKTSGSNIRVWIAGCSTGEEVYSIAILIDEYLKQQQDNIFVQIFATDIDSIAIDKARVGIFSLDIANSVSKERLQNYFTKTEDENAYKIKKEIRDMIIFSVHNVIKDPPFVRLDLISCRNLMIYMNVELQKKLISLFNYALNSEGILLLGSSESLGTLEDLYTVVDSKLKIFKTIKTSNSQQKTIINHYSPVRQELTSVWNFNKAISSAKLPLRELTESAILEQIATATVLVNEKGDILYIHGNAGMYLEIPSGETNTNNILQMARDGLKNPLTLAFYKAINSKRIVRSNSLIVKIHNQTLVLNLVIKMVNLGEKIKSESSLYIVLLEEDFLEKNESSHEQRSLKEPGANMFSDEDSQILSLKQELQLQKEFLQNANQQLETNNEELKSYNEEIQSMNEELQSTNEELETSKEELQSVNEELYSTNSELNDKITDLSRSNNDMNNLLAGTGIGTVFVDHNLNILRFTPSVVPIINLILGDVGRPVGNIVSNLVGYDTLVQDIQKVLDTLIPKEIEVMNIDSKFYLMRIQPYRTLDNVIEGAVVSFVDISEMHFIKDELKKANDLSRLAVVVRDSSDAIIVENLNGKIIAWNPQAELLYGWSEAEALSMDAKKRIPKDLEEDELVNLSELKKSKVIQAHKTKRLAKDGSLVHVHIVSSNLVDENNKVYATTFTERAL